MAQGRAGASASISTGTLPYASTSSRNDLFSASWAPDVPPPRPLLERDAAPSSSRPFRGAVEDRLCNETIDELSNPPVQTSASAIGSPRTSSFFDVTIGTTPSPAPRLSKTPAASFAPSPLSLSRASSVRRPLPPLEISLASNDDFFPLHQSPSLPSTSTHSPTWQPPIPPSSDDVEMRFIPTPDYLLGQGRYARVYLAAYRRDAKGKGREGDDEIDARVDHLDARADVLNARGDGLIGGSWRLCAAKRMASDRESQTLGLREAFFLNRLTAQPNTGGSVYVVKLIAVKEDGEGARRASMHSRSASDVLMDGVRPATRQRSSTLGLGKQELLVYHPSLSSLGRAAKTGAPSELAASRLVLLLEHAPLGTVDRLLRTSPKLVGKHMWARWARQTAAALRWVHARGVIHADLKPGNLLLTNDLDIRLSDFGSSLLVHPAHPPTDGLGLGTLPFSPPELVDPNQSFSFPVDIFALGATLYQCVTGKEPYRGVRPVEMMHHVRQGNLWIHEERERIGRIGSTAPSTSGSPYPSAWRAQDPTEFGVKRGGSLRVPPDRPRLPRMASAESLRASEDAESPNNSTPSGVKLWATWMRRPAHGPVSRLLSDTGDPSGDESVLRQPSDRSTASCCTLKAIIISLSESENVVHDVFPLLLASFWGIGPAVARRDGLGQSARWGRTDNAKNNRSVA